MKVTCQYSGVTYEVENFAGVYLQQGEHPLMSENVKLDVLEKLYKDYCAEKLKLHEQRLLFVAYMKYTNMFKFSVPANPSPNIILMNMEPMRNLANYLDVVTNPRLIIPQYHISETTRNCGTINNFLETCHLRLLDMKNNFRNAHLRERLDDIEAKLMKSLKSPYNDPAAQYRYLARWTMIATDAPRNLWEHWMPIFNVTGLDIFKIHTATLDELLDHMDEHMAAQFSQYSPTLAVEALKRIRTIHATHHNGIGSFVGIDEFELANIDFNNISDFHLIDDDTETKNMRSIAQSAPTTEPHRGDFDKTIDYLKAKAAWNIAKDVAHKQQMLQAARDKFEAEQAKKLQEDGLDSSHEIDENQTSFDWEKWVEKSNDE